MAVELTALSVLTIATDDTVSGGTDDFQGCVQNDDSLDKVYAIKPTEAGTVTVGTYGLAPEARYGLSIRTSCDEQDSQIACEGLGAAGNSNVVTFFADGVSTYFIIVDGLPGAGTGTFSLGASLVPGLAAGQASDTCPDATAAVSLASGQTLSLTGDTSSASASITVPLIDSCTTVAGSETTGPEQFFAITPEADGTLSVEVDPGDSNYNPVLYVGSSCTTFATALACANEANEGLETLNVSVTGGQTYYLVFDSFSATAVGSFSANISLF